MPHDVFISYSTQDAAIADDVVRALEGAGIRCWIASRDIPPGSPNWAGEIEQAIRQARAMVLIVSPQFNDSVQTPKEIILGIDERLFILPIRIADFQPWSHLRYFLADRQWVDASSQPVQQRLDLVVRVLRYKLAGTPAEAEEPVPSAQPQFEGVQAAEALGVLPLGPRLKLELWQPMKLRNDQPSLWLQAYNALVPMSGREQEVEELLGLLRAEGQFRWRVCFGEAGMGKTRLAIEFVRRARSDGWHAGFASSSNLRSFVGSERVISWRPCVPTLVVVDYAASKLSDLRRLFEHLSSLEARTQQEADTAAAIPPVRVLLLERHADSARGWLQELLAAGEGMTGDLLRNVCFQGIKQLQPPGGKGSTPADFTHRIIEDTFKRWASITGRTPPALPDFTEKDWRRIQLRTGNRPLYLQMAALHACERGSAVQLPTWGRGDLLKAALARERRYVEKECEGNHELRKAVEHITAMLCLAGVGAARGRQWLRIVDEELKAIGLSSISAHQAEHHRRAIFAETQPGAADAETGVIQPDIVSEGFAAQVLQEEEEGGPPTEALRQVLCLSGVRAWANMVRMVQDLVGIEKHLFGPAHAGGIDGWLPPLLADRPVEELRQLVHIIPERSISLHEFAVLVNEQLLDRIPRSHAAERAECLLSLGIHRCRLGRPNRTMSEQAIRELQEAIQLFTSLPLDGQGGYRSKLAKAYRLLGNTLSNLGQNEEAVRNTWTAARLASGDSPKPSDAPLDLANAPVAGLRVPETQELMSEFAKCLNCLSIDLHALQHNSAAKAAAARAVEVGEALIAHSWPAYAADLARYLNNLGLAQMACHETTAAIESCRRSAQIRSEFAQENPDEYAQPLSLTLSNLVSLEYAQKNITGAQAATEQLIGIYEDLSARNPGVYRAALAQCFHNIGYLCDDSGSRDEAVRYTQEGLRMREELLESDFDAHALDLAWSHHNLAYMYRSMDQTDKALPHMEKAYALRARWVENAPGREVAELVQSANSMAQMYQQKGDKDAEALWLNRVVSDWERCSGSAHSKAMALHDVATALGRLGRTVEAGAAAHGAAELLRQEFTAHSPEADVVGWATAGCNLASALALAGDWRNDVPVLSECIGLCQGVLSHIAPEKEGCSFLWGAMLNNLGHAQFRSGELLGQVDMIRQGVESLMSGAQHHRDHGYPASAEETTELALRAQACLDSFRTVGGNESHSNGAPSSD